MTKNLKILTSIGILWNGISQFSIQIFQFITIIILARLLTPEDFGIIGLATLFTGLISVINELGMSAAIIQRKDISDTHMSTSFWASICMGITLFILTVVISPFVADFFNEELIRPILIVSSIGLVIGSFGVVQRALLEKNIDFKNITVIEICAAFGSGTISILLAIKGFGVWSIVLGSVSGTFISIVILWKISKWRPSLKFSFKHFKELFSFGSNVAGSQLLNYIAMRVDYLIIGKMLGTTSLGYYSLARMITSLPVQKVSWSVMRVTFPAFSSVQDNRDVLKKGYLNVIKYVSLITFPMLAGIFVVAPEFIHTFYGTKWIPVIALVQILTIQGAIVSVSAMTGTIQYAKGRSDIQFKWQIFTAIIMTIAVLIGSNYGITGVAISLTITTFVLAFIIQSITNKLIDLHMRNYLEEIVPATVSSTLLVIGVITYKNIITINMDNNMLVTLLSSIGIGIMVYLLLIWKFYKYIFNDAKLLIHEMRE